MRVKYSFRILLRLFCNICLYNLCKDLTVRYYPVHLIPIKTKILSSPFPNRFKYLTNSNLKYNTNILYFL